MPKQFVPLIDERSTFQQVLGRIANTDLFDRPIVITHSDFRFIAAEQLRECDIEADIVLEPSRRDSAMAVAVAAELAGKRRPHACVLVLAADHVVRNAEALENQLKAQNRPQADQHLRVYRPWGYYQGIDIGARYQVKRIVVKPNATLSLQKHFHRAEHWVVVRGTAEIVVGTETRNVHENESVYIPIGSLHRLGNPGKIPLELIEVQVGSYLAEDDIVRVTDQYGRD